MSKLWVNFSVRLTGEQRDFLDEKKLREGRRSSGNALRRIIEEEMKREKEKANE